MLSSRKGDELSELEGSLPGGADRHQVVVADLSEQGAAEELIGQAADLDGLVANAAMPGTGKLERLGVRRSPRLSESTWRRRF